MTYEDFKVLNEEEQKAVFTGLDERGILYDDMEAERDSLYSENEKLREELQEIRAETKKTKELNFTLARQIKAEPVKSAEDILHDMFIGGKKT